MRNGFVSADRLATVALGSLGLLCVVVGAVGLVGVVAEWLQTWQYYFVMERTVALAAPITVALAGTTVLAGVAAAAWADSA